MHMQEFLLGTKDVNVDDLWLNYKLFCNYASSTRDLRSESVTDFLGWMAISESYKKENN